MSLWGDTITWFQKHVVEPSNCLHSIEVLHGFGKAEMRERYPLEAPFSACLVIVVAHLIRNEKAQARFL